MHSFIQFFVGLFVCVLSCFVLICFDLICFDFDCFMLQSHRGKESCLWN
jgi:hypothetical protein